MNALSISGNRVHDPDVRRQYFDSMAKFGFDTAYVICCEPQNPDMPGAEGHAAFVKEAHQSGYPACINIQTAFLPAGFDPADGQYTSDDDQVCLADGSCPASYVSEAWKDHLRSLTELFVRQYGYDWVVFDEPVRAVEIPGPSDKIRPAFEENYPGVEYPKSRSESPGYLQLQRLQADMIVGFCSDLVAHARDAGAEKVGMAPRRFMASDKEQAPDNALLSADVGRLASLKQVDFLIAGRQSGSSEYTELMAHACGKPVVAAVGSSNEELRTLLEILAASPSGILVPSEGESSSDAEASIHAVSSSIRLANRLGDPVSPVGFLFSYRGTRHVDPPSHETALPAYREVIEHLLLKQKMPVRTLYADSLAKNLEANSSLQLLILDEHFPLTIAQARILRQWWAAAPGHALIVFGSGLGYSAEDERTGQQPTASAFQEIVQAIGIRQEPEAQVDVAGGKLRMEHVSRVSRTAFLGNTVEVLTPRIANVGRIFGSRSAVLYQDAETATPVIVQHAIGDSFGYFCGFGLSRSTAAIAAEVIKYACERLRVPPATVSSESPGLIWNQTSTGYIVVSNTSDAVADLRLTPDNNLIWDVTERVMLPEGPTSLTVNPLSMRLLRKVGKRSKLYDVSALYVTSIVDGAGRADISAFTGPRVSFILRTEPKEVRVDGRNYSFEGRRLEDSVELTLDNLTTSDHLFTIRW